MPEAFVHLSKSKNKNILVLYVCVLLAVDLPVWEHLSALLYQCNSHMYTFTAIASSHGITTMKRSPVFPLGVFIQKVTLV